MNPPPGKPGPVVIRENTFRNSLIAVGAGIVVLIFVAYGVVQMASPVKGNKLTGTIVEKVFIPQKERQVSFSGRKIEGAREVAGEYFFKVRVPEQNRTYDVPVEQPMYESKSVGDSMTFLRPPSEQK